MLELKSVKAFHLLMTTRQALVNSTASRLLGFEHRHKAHRVLKVGWYG